MMMHYLEVLGCLGTALVELLGGEVDFKVMDGFEVILVDEFTLVLVNVKGFEGGAGSEIGMCRKVSQAAKNILKFDITGKDLLESLGSLSAPAPPPPPVCLVWG